MKARHSIQSLVVLVGTAVLLAACGGGSSASTAAKASGSPSQLSSTGGTSSVKISNFKFSPPSLTTNKGARVTVTNEDSATHSLSADDGSFDTGNLAHGASGTISVSKPGTYSYHCSIHPFMHGTLIVK